jgi:MraZ protein
LVKSGKIVLHSLRQNLNLPLMTTLFGVHESTVDAKGRVMLPGPFKKQLATVLDKGFVMRISMDHPCLELYPLETWKDISSDLRKTNRFTKEDKDWVRMFSFGVRSTELDSNARFLISKEQMESVGVKKDIVIASQNDYLEIWDRKAYYKFIDDNRKNYELLTQKVMGRIKQEGDGK